MADELADARLEREISAIQAKLDALWAVRPVSAINRAEIAAIWPHFIDLINSRSEAQITRMERDRGLE